MAKIIDLKGQRFGKLIVIRLSHMDKEGQSVWRCKCECGKFTNVRSNSLRRGNTQSCGCKRYEIIPSNKLPYGEAAQNRLYTDYKKSAKYRKILFKLSKLEFFELTTGRCYYCGTHPSNVIKSPSNNGDYVYSGIDRLDNKIGYIIKNCVPCCKICNRAKREITENVFNQWIKNLVEYHNENSFSLS